MQIRRKLTYQFLAIVATIMLLSSIAIYYFSANYRKADFYTRLLNKANNTVRLLIEVDEVDAKLLAKIDKDNPVSLPKEKIIIINYKNKVLYSTDKQKKIKITPDLLDKIRLEKEIRYKQGDYEILAFLFIEKYDRTIVIAGAIDEFGLRKLKNLRMVLFIVFGFGITLTFFAGWIYAGRALSPISNVVKQVENITITSLNLRVDEGNGEDEIAKLALTFNKMLERLETAFTIQKNFIANASHELRTPLTAITGQLEVVLMNERTNHEYQQTLHSVLEDMRNLNNISNRLLLLAQASSESSDVGFTNLRIDDIIWQTIAELQKRNNNYKINVDFDNSIGDDAKLTIKGNEQLLKAAVSNLIDNGCKYSFNHQVDIHIGSDGKYTVIQFTDNGIGIEKNDLIHIFEPFYRGENALSVKGHGIGLSLVEKIIKLHKGDIIVTSRVNVGTTFSVMLSA
jgi:signal transduction histidine kinase